MSDINWRGWKITDEQAEQIRNGNPEACNTFYLDNLDRLRKMAFNYASKHARFNGLAEDMIQGIYVDMSVFESAYNRPVVDGINLSRWVYRSFVFSPHGGLAYLTEHNPKLLFGGGLRIYSPDTLSLDSPLPGTHGRNGEENTKTLADVLSATELLQASDHTEECKIAVSDFLAPREREYFENYIEGYSENIISQRMGYTTHNNNGARVRKKLVSHCSEVLERLDSFGIDVDQYAHKTPYDPKTERTYKLTPEQRAKAAESMRRQRAAKKAGTLLPVA